MKRLLPLLIFAMLAATQLWSLTVEDVVKLSKLKTSEELILSALQKEKLSKPLSSRDLLYLKQQGVSERVIQYMWKIAGTEDAPVNAAGDRLRTYTTVNAKGKKVTVVTNIDKNGKRMGGEAPFIPAPVYVPAPAARETDSDLPREIHVTVTHNEPPQSRDEIVEYAPPPYSPGYLPLYQQYPVFVPYPIPCTVPSCGYHPRRHTPPPYRSGAQWEVDARDRLNRRPTR